MTVSSRKIQDFHHSKKKATLFLLLSKSQSHPLLSKILPQAFLYRGNRMLSDGAEFLLQDVKSRKISDDCLCLELSFNQSVNPRTFTSESILIDGQEISSKIKFSFNKKGDTIKVEIPSKSENFSLMIQNVESFDGIQIEPVKIDIK